MKPLEINETATLENGDVVKCVERPQNINCIEECNICYFGPVCKINVYDNPKFDCFTGSSVHFELVKNISLESENIEKKE